MVSFEKNGFTLQIFKKFEEFILLFQRLKAAFPTEKFPFLSEKEMQCKNEEILIYATMKFSSFLNHISKNRMMSEFMNEFLTENVNKTFNNSFG